MTPLRRGARVQLELLLKDFAHFIDCDVALPALGALDPVLDSSLIQAADPPLVYAVAAHVRAASAAQGVLIAGFAARPRDVLTGCLTYEATIRDLDREINHSARGGLYLSVCFIDLDDFKDINDCYGHLCGNEVLARIGQILRDGVRSCDSVGRYGGDEFIAILPQTSEMEARRLDGRLGTRPADTAIPPLERPLTASIGVAQWIPGTRSEIVLEAADGALLSEKQRRPEVVTTRGSRSSLRSKQREDSSSTEDDVAGEVA